MIIKYTGKDLDALIDAANKNLVQEVLIGDAVIHVKYEMVSTSAILQSHDGTFILLVTYKQA